MYGFTNLFTDAISDVGTTATADVGTLRQHAGNLYRYVYNGSASTIAVGNGVILTAGASDFTVTLSSVSNDSRCVGVIKHTALPTLNYGWALVNGIGTVLAGPSISFAAGANIGLGANGVFAPVTGATGVGVGTSLSAAASGASATAFIACL